MIPLLFLATAVLALRVAGVAGIEALDSWPSALRGGLAAMLVLTGSAHFTGRRRDLVAMVPPMLPRPQLLVTVTGVLELTAAVGLIVPSTHRWAAISVAALFVLMFPANVHAARGNVTIGRRPATPLVPRALIQAVFIATAVVIAV
jgi:uncharacterized membrane protein